MYDTWQSSQQFNMTHKQPKQICVTIHPFTLVITISHKCKYVLKQISVLYTLCAIHSNFDNNIWVSVISISNGNSAFETSVTRRFLKIALYVNINYAGFIFFFKYSLIVGVYGA